MPELPEVETVRRGLEPVLVKHRLIAVDVRRTDLRRPLPDGFSRKLTGRRVNRLTRRAKYLLVHLDDGTVLIVHLGMSGRVRVHDHPAVPEVHDHVIFRTDAGQSIHYCDPRRFGLMELTNEKNLATHPLLVNLGPEPQDLEGPALAARLAGRSGPLKTALLDQRAIAGLGNIYVCEALFRARLSPFRKASTVWGRRADRLSVAIRSVLGEAIAAGGSSLRDHRQPDGELGYFQHTFAVYGREGEPCPHCDCGGGVQRVSQGGRSTFYCAKLQS